MVNYVNFSSRYIPSVHYDRQNLNNRYISNALMSRNYALSNCDCSNTFLPAFNFMPPTMGVGYFGWSPWMFPPMQSYMTGNVFGQSIGLGINLVRSWLC